MIPSSPLSPLPSLLPLLVLRDVLHAAKIKTIPGYVSRPTKLKWNSNELHPYYIKRRSHVFSRQVFVAILLDFKFRRISNPKGKISPRSPTSRLNMTLSIKFRHGRHQTSILVPPTFSVRPKRWPQVWFCVGSRLPLGHLGSKRSGHAWRGSLTPSLIARC